MELFLILALGFVMGVVTALSGGAGVFAVPAMMAMGFPPVNVLALNKLSDLGVLAGAIGNYARHDGMNWKLALMASVPMFIGSAIGASISVSIAPELLRWIIVCAVFVGIFFLLYPYRPQTDEKPPNYFVGVPLLLVLGMWNGSMGMAGATFGVLIFVRIFRRDYLSARVIEVMAVVPATIVSTLILSFNTSGLSSILAGGMFFTSLLGGYVGSKIAIARGSQFIRYAMVGISLLILTKVILVDIFKVHGWF